MSAVEARNQQEAERTLMLFPCENPVYPHMQRLENRARTFQERKSSTFVKSTPTLLAKAGFFYSGIIDDIVCWYCGGGLDGWDYCNDPWYGHAKFHSNCEYVLREKGLNYVEEIMINNSTAPTPAPRSRAGEQHSVFLEEIERQSPAPSNINIFPQPNWQRREFENGFGQTTTVYKAPGIQITNTRQSPSGTLHNRTVVKTQEPSVVGNSQNSPYSEIIGKALDMGFSLDQIKNALSRRLLQAEQIEINFADLVKDIIENIGEEQLRRKREKSARGHLNTANEPTACFPNATSTSHEETHRTNLRVSHHKAERPPSASTSSEVSYSRGKCTLCNDKPRKIVFLPCGHLVTCSNCSHLLRYCPVCNAEIERRIKVKTALED